MAYDRATDAPARYQFEVSSGTLNRSQVWNCGVASVAKIAQYRNDRWYGIESGRAIIAGMGPYRVSGYGTVYGCPPSMPTTGWQQRDMLRQRGVACEVYAIPNLSALINLVAGGRRPVILGLNFARVPDAVAGHTFQGWHAVVVMDTGTKGGVGGFWVNDPNFSPPGGPRPDPTRGKRFYSRTVMATALADLQPNWAVVPVSAKHRPSDPVLELTEAREMAILSNITVATGRKFAVSKGTVLRKGPGTSFPKHWTVPDDMELWLIGFYPNEWVAASRGQRHDRHLLRATGALT